MQKYTRTKNADGTFEINQKKDSKCAVVRALPKIYTKQNQYTARYYIWYDSFQSPNDFNGMYITIDEIEMNSELTQEALKNEAMKALHHSGNIFRVTSQQSALLLNDACAWIRSTVGISQATGGFCYVATCIYGSYDCPEVWTLRRFRDNTLASTWYGRFFVKAYYKTSPILVKWFGHKNWFKSFWKNRLDSMVKSLQAKGVASTNDDLNWYKCS